jgi:hypothetical protein
MGTGSTGTVGELNCNTAANDDETVCNAEPYCAWYPLEIGETETGTIVTGYCDVDCAALPNTSSCEAQECCYLSGSDCLYDAGFCQPI